MEIKFSGFIKSLFKRFLILILSQVLIIASLIGTSIWDESGSYYSRKKNYTIGENIIVQINEIIDISVQYEDQFDENINISGKGGDYLNFLPTFGPVKKLGGKKSTSSKSSDSLTCSVAA
ncbi:MAG: hypothetical protein KAS39_06695, partial [Actinomycetia bacterium]|nr:hypothetical protein [Actinomycetes bacterium]